MSFAQFILPDIVIAKRMAHKMLHVVVVVIFALHGCFFLHICNEIGESVILVALNYCIRHQVISIISCTFSFLGILFY